MIHISEYVGDGPWECMFTTISRNRRESSRSSLDHVDELSYILHITNIAFGSLNFLFHVLGFYLLLTLYRKGSDERNEQQLLIIVLSLVDCFMNLFLWSNSAATISILSENDYFHDMNVIAYFTSIAISFEYVYYLSMTCIMVDIVLGMNYKAVWDRRNRKILLAVAWSVAITIMIAICIVVKMYRWGDLFYSCDKIKGIQVNEVSGTVNFSVLILINVIYLVIATDGYRNERPPKIHLFSSEIEDLQDRRRKIENNVPDYVSVKSIYLI